MLGQSGYIHSLGGVTNGAGKELFALFGMGRLYSDHAFVPLVHFLLLSAADAGAVMVIHIAVALCPGTKGVLRGLFDCLGLGGLADFARIGQNTLRGVGSGSGDHALVPLVGFFLFGAAGTGAVMVIHIAVALCPGTKGVLRGLFDCLGLGGLADFARIGQNTFRGVCSGSGDHAFIPLVGFGDFSVAFFAGLRVVLTVFYGPTSGGEAVAVVVRVQRELESLRGGRDGASCVRKQRAALGADVVRLCTLYRTG